MIDIGKERIVRVMELSGMSGTRPEIVSRVSPGRLNTYLHMKAAKDKGYLIPDVKKGMEQPKSLYMLSMTDKGGLIFYPEPGIYENVAKCDFASMYPNIIVRCNISPETVNCKCCANDPKRIRVPDTDWHICVRRKGIIPEGIRAVLERRLELKKLMKKETNPEIKRDYDIRQKALKNILVTCFGYLGFKNFIFSNVECKECVMLFGRHILLGAKLMAEDLGLEVAYGITDSLFVHGRNRKAYEAFVEAVTARTGIELEMDCIFSRIAFPAAVDGAGIANKYYGITEQGEIEARGICLRRSDVPELLRAFQRLAIPVILSDDIRNTYPHAKQMLEHCKYLVSNRKIPLHLLSITRRLRRPLGAYSSNAPHVVAGRRLTLQGAQPETHPTNRPGKTSSHIDYVWTNDGPYPIGPSARDISMEQVSSWKYCELLDASLVEMTRGLR
jgi:DNA polymerase elongation subunit (family B)